MRPSKDTEQIANEDLKIDKWRVRSALERRTDQDSRKESNAQYFISGGRERRSGKERRQAAERRERWMRIGKWRSELVFED